MNNDNISANYNETEFDNEINLDELEEQLNADLEEQMQDLAGFENDFEKIGSPEALGETVMNVVWEQFINQVGVVAGEDFIRENRGLTLDLRDSAHIQTTDDFAKGNIVKHNTKIDYQKRHDDWQANFVKDENGKVRTKYDRIDNEEKAVLVNGYRAPYDKGRKTGSASIHMDETVSVAEQVRDPAANAHLSLEERVAFDQSKKNLNPIDASANESKGDHRTANWLKSERNGQKPAERFNIDEEQMLNKDSEAREEFEKLKSEGEQRSIEAGKTSQKEEAFRIGGKALRAAIMGLVAELARNIIQKLVSWFRSANKKLETLIDSIKEAIHKFINNLKQNLLTAGNTLLTSIATAIFGPIVSMIKKAWIFLKQGGKSLKEAINYIKAPENKNKSFSILMLEVGKIVIAGLTAGGAILLGETIEKALMTFPVFAFEIPLLGSLASILGIFLGAVVSGIIGAIALHLIDKAIAKRQKRINVENQLEKGNQVLTTQRSLTVIAQVKAEQAESTAIDSIQVRHQEFMDAVKDIADNMKESVENIDKMHEKNQNDFDNLQSMLDNL